LHRATPLSLSKSPQSRLHADGVDFQVAVSQTGAAYLRASRSMPGADPHSAD
jgi:hypothetical protein